MLERRNFIKAAALGGLSVGAMRSAGELAANEPQTSAWNTGGRGASELARDEAHWSPVRRDFAPAPDFVNIEYGYFCPAALPVLEAELRGARDINARASFFMRREMGGELEAARADLAALAGVESGEVAITRNTTESMNIVLQGLDLKPGDEIVYSDQDYGSMNEAMRQKSARDGVALKQVSLPLHPESDDAIVSAFAEAITEQTRLLHVTHMINLTGQLLPVRKICAMAHRRGVEVLVDAAHSFAHIDFRIGDLDCDYLGASLHKWLCSPVGLGLLYVKREKIPKVWGLMGDMARDRGDIRKGTLKNPFFPRQRS